MKEVGLFEVVLKYVVGYFVVGQAKMLSFWSAV